MRIHARPGHTSFGPGVHTGGDFGTAFQSSPASGGKQPGTPLDTLSELAEWRTLEERAKNPEPRWASSVMPLGVYIEAHPDWPTDDVAARRERLLKMMRQWEAASRGELRFKNVLSKEQGDVVITWTSDTTLGRDYEVGHANLDVTTANVIRHAHITLVTNPRIDGHLSPTQQEQRLLATILHETGHALGLRHSEYKRDVMHHQGWRNMYLSANDAERIRTLYQPAPPLRV